MRAEHRQAQGVQQCDECGFRCIGEGIAQRERALGGQFGDEPVGERTDGVILFVGSLGLLNLAPTVTVGPFAASAVEVSPDA